MRWWMAGMLVGIGVLAGCRDEGAEVTVDETRALTTRDVAPKLFATSDERFRNARPGPVSGEAPAQWAAAPASEFRVLNYRFGASGKGEVYVTITTGGMAENINRWLGQFGAAPLDDAGVAALRRVPMLGAAGAWVEAAGSYRGAMGRPEDPGFAMVGAVAEVGGRIVTVKMVGPAAEVAAEKAALESFAATLRLVE